ncbi:U1 small nuclear ribonucleoprotein C [Dispira simplex]|nr:U1 small nuclear ribonucleoprotein C [Dispira simplex]
MPKYYCDYCDIFLTHDTPAVRKAHNQGWKHRAQVEKYYSALDKDKTQVIVDAIVKAYTTDNPTNAKLPAGFTADLASFTQRSSSGPIPPTSVMPTGYMPPFPPTGSFGPGGQPPSHPSYPVPPPPLGGYGPSYHGPPRDNKDHRPGPRFDSQRDYSRRGRGGYSNRRGVGNRGGYGSRGSGGPPRRSRFDRPDNRYPNSSGAYRDGPQDYQYDRRGSNPPSNSGWDYGPPPKRHHA